MKNNCQERGLKKQENTNCNYVYHLQLKSSCLQPCALIIRNLILVPQPCVHFQAPSICLDEELVPGQALFVTSSVMK